MKIIILIFGAILILTYTAFAQQDSTGQTSNKLSAQECQQALNSYLVSLNYENHGVVQSAIYHIMQIKCQYPLINYQPVIRKLDELRDNGDSHQIKAMALLCSEYLKQQQLTPAQRKEAEQIFAVLMHLPEKH